MEFIQKGRYFLASSEKLGKNQYKEKEELFVLNDYLLNYRKEERLQ